MAVMDWDELADKTLAGKFDRTPGNDPEARAQMRSVIAEWRETMVTLPSEDRLDVLTGPDLQVWSDILAEILAYTTSLNRRITEASSWRMRQSDSLSKLGGYGEAKQGD